MLRTEGSQERLDNVAELKQLVYAYETTCGEESRLTDYLAHVALFTKADADTQADRVRMMTVHAAKGLEFPHVFLCGMNEGIFPSRKVRTRQEMEEERRLAFVALTRAPVSYTHLVSSFSKMRCIISFSCPPALPLSCRRSLFCLFLSHITRLLRKTHAFSKTRQKTLSKALPCPKALPF